MLLKGCSEMTRYPECFAFVVTLRKQMKSNKSEMNQESIFINLATTKTSTYVSGKKYRIKYVFLILPALFRLFACVF